MGMASGSLGRPTDLAVFSLASSGLGFQSQGRQISFNLNYLIDLGATRRRAEKDCCWMSPFVVIGVLIAVGLLLLFCSLH
jgi:hypothetical protein